MDVNSKDGKNSRRRGRPMESVEYVDLGSDTFFPHMPLASTAEAEGKEVEVTTSGVRGDLPSILLLVFLYVLQGIPLGLAGSIPMLLQSRKVSYKDQALFSLVYWPFSIKLLWAPLVDSMYLSWFGRRKTWLIPIQYLIGLFMIVLSGQIKSIFREDGNGNVSVVYLTVIFFALNFLAATQDIAVDGWALTMLSRKNIGWASTCNSVGQTAGYFIGNVLFLALESADFCNDYLRSVPEKTGIVTLSGFLWFWGIMFFATTTVVGILKKENMDLSVDPDQGVVETYRTLFDVIRLPAIISHVVILLTSKLAFAGSDALTALKLIEAGIPKERLALFAVPMVPIQIALPLVISKYTSGPKPMEIWLKAYPFRILLGTLFCVIVYWAHFIQPTPGEFPWYFYVVTLVAYGLHQVFVYCMFVSQMAFHAKVSDPAIGGTYMTLLNTVANLGGNWPSTAVLWMVDYLTWKNCSNGNSCDGKEFEKACTDSGETCVISWDGYYILCALSVFIGIVWMKWQSRCIRQLGELSDKAWKCNPRSTS